MYSWVHNVYVYRQHTQHNTIKIQHSTVLCVLLIVLVTQTVASLVIVLPKDRYPIIRAIIHVLVLFHWQKNRTEVVDVFQIAHALKMEFWPGRWTVHLQTWSYKIQMVLTTVIHHTQSSMKIAYVRETIKIWT